MIVVVVVMAIVSELIALVILTVEKLSCEVLRRFFQNLFFETFFYICNLTQHGETHQEKKNFLLFYRTPCIVYLYYKGEKHGYYNCIVRERRRINM
jgi:hypothetical protein